MGCGMTVALSSLPAQTSSVPSYPTTASGKRNWAWSAVHPGEAIPSKDTIPAQDLSFGDLVDVINPLQHIPVVGSIYRAITGDTVSAPAQAVGDFLFGGPVGLAAGLVGSGLEALGIHPVTQALAALGVGDGGGNLMASAPSRISATNAYQAASRL